MKDKRKSSKGWWPLLALVAGLVIWYLGLDKSHKRFVQNLVRQIPYLPARYAV